MMLFLKKVKRRLFTVDKINVKGEFIKKSYSQCGEDLIVKFIFDNLNIINPTYLDIGAHHPHHISNTALFHENGSTGINIEPDPTLFQAFLKERKNDINLNIGVGNKTELLDFYVMSSSTLNTFSFEEANNYQKEGNYRIVDTKKIMVKTLSEILIEYCNSVFPQFLSLDAEGIDEIIIKSIDFENNYPIVICIETISFSTTGNGIKNTELIKYIESKGYLLYADTYINTIFVRENIWRYK